MCACVCDVRLLPRPGHTVPKTLPTPWGAHFTVTHTHRAAAVCWPPSTTLLHNTRTERERGEETRERRKKVRLRNKEKKGKEMWYEQRGNRKKRENKETEQFQLMSGCTSFSSALLCLGLFMDKKVLSFISVIIFRICLTDGQGHIQTGSEYDPVWVFTVGHNEELYLRWFLGAAHLCIQDLCKLFSLFSTKCLCI